MKTCVGIVGIAVTYAALAVPAPVAAQAGFPTKRVEPFRFLSDATWNELAGRYTED